jgi:hypothetical protein
MTYFDVYCTKQLTDIRVIPALYSIAPSKAVTTYVVLYMQVDVNRVCVE